MNIILPSYITKLPSTGKSVSFRPFTVKEEKSLLLALQENNLYTITNAIKNTVKICTDNKIDPDNHPYYDIEFLFLEIRSKSVGEIIELVGSCDCSETAKTEFSIDIAEKVLEPLPDKEQAIIKIPDSAYTIVVRHPSISNFVEAFDNEIESGAATVARCITSVYTDDEMFNWTYEEKLEFVESMSPKQQTDIIKFFENMPMVKMYARYTCKKCKKEHEEILSGFENFFV